MRGLYQTKKASVAELPAFFQVMMLVVIFAGLTFIVAEKFMDTTVNDSRVSGTTNLEAGYLNETGYTLAQSTLDNFANPTINGIQNATDSNVILAGNYTLTGNVLTNATTTVWSTVEINYTYSYLDGSLTPYTAINDSTNDLYDYGVGFLGIIILVTMVYLIINIVSGANRRR